MRTLILHSAKGIKSLAIVYSVFLAVIIYLNNSPATRHLFYGIATVKYLDKIGHLFMMGFLSLIVNLALNAKSARIFRFRYLLGSMIVLAVVTAEEFSQLFLVTRTFEFTDMFFNTLGIFLFGEMARLIVNIFNRYKLPLKERS